MKLIPSIPSRGVSIVTVILLPTGFTGYGIKTRAVKGHEFGMDLSFEDKKALIAFLKTL